MLRSLSAQWTALFDAPFGAYEQDVLRRYALAALLPEKGQRGHAISESFLKWYQNHRDLLGFRVAPLEAILRRSKASREFPSLIEWQYTMRDLPTYTAKRPTPSAFQTRLNWVADTLGLSVSESAFLGAVVRMTRVQPFFEFYDAVMVGHNSDDEVLATTAARMAGLTPRESWGITDRRGALVQLGLIEDRGGGDVAASATVVDLLATRSSDPQVLRHSLLGQASKTELSLADFDHLGASSRTVLTLLDGALERGESGASLLFYGAPGTGKTEFAKLVASEIAADVVFIGERRTDASARNFRSEPSRSDRLSHLAFVSALASRAGRVVLVIDEADEVFSGVDDEDGFSRSGSKVFMNRVVENCPVPMIWITNHPDRLGEAVLRRMLFAAEFRDADRSTRRRIIERHASEHKIQLSPLALEGLAGLPATPALLGTGLRAAAIAAVQSEDAGQLAISVTRSLLRVAGRVIPPSSSGETMAFDASFSQADVDLPELEKQVVAAGPGALSFLLSGPPGTGKSAFARHLAERLELEVLEKKGSDLLGMFVGETEKRIADAFAQAAEAGRFLILDEADSLLSDRAGAQRSWEISQVNEMLTWMERHPTPFAATTNLSGRFDPATQRRFLFKVQFAPMVPAQIQGIFRRTFGVDAPPHVSSLPQLTPGDFNVVARRAKVLRVTDPILIGDMLEKEVLAKPGVTRRIGF
ncbi:AAA+-type ATPase, SpoVK/Ycf46/Vps4 family [Devosia sp. YR412]|uniref:AAA family ATPase n=1 Tax=Devosia sp. YR412 TaxID=1881030 RepID=UPI0008D088EF|nr:ATP-binding protein [Devosia sp. YR412]SEP82106.1 AAA+-type ATPase, SpoVK/Ycf46/Vps4 family [Devosia sp. YR412]